MFAPSRTEEDWAPTIKLFGDISRGFHWKYISLRERAIVKQLVRWLILRAIFLEHRSKGGGIWTWLHYCKEYSIYLG